MYIYYYRYYFAVSNMEAGVEYKMNILNLIKPDSLYNVGMRPALFSGLLTLLAFLVQKYTY